MTSVKKMKKDEFEVQQLIAQLTGTKGIEAYLVQWTISPDEPTMEPLQSIFGQELIPDFHKAAKHHPSRWFYYLDKPASWSGQTVGWHEYPLATCVQIENNLTATTTLQSGKFTYEIDPTTMVQRNVQTGTIRPIRRLLMLADTSVLSLAQRWNGTNYAS